MTNDGISKEKEVRIMEISMTPAFVALFIAIFYLLHLETVGIEVSESFFANSIMLVISVSSIVCLTLNEALLKINGGKFKFRRLAFRSALLSSYFFLIWVVSFFLTMLFPWAETFFQFFFGMLIGTAIFVTVILRLRHLFDRLDKGE